MKHVLSTNDPRIAEHGQKMNQNRHLRNKRVARMIFFLVATFAFCYLPFLVIFLSRRYGAWNMQRTEEVNTYVSLVLVAKCIAYANSCMNPFLYLFMSRAFRCTFKDVILCCKKRKYLSSARLSVLHHSHFRRQY